MGLVEDLKVLYSVNCNSIRGENHAERLESFYGPQASLYDSFREKFLHGRREMVTHVPLPDQSVWIDLGAGTGSNLEYVAVHIPSLKHVYLVDLTDSLLQIARERVERHGWNNVSIVKDDASRWKLGNGVADVVTFSYSLTMIPDWFQAIDQAIAMLREGGHIGVADFYVSRKHPDLGRAKHGGWLRTWWKYFFARDNVFLNEDHLPYLERNFDVVKLKEARKRIPYIPFPKVPYYYFVGRKSTQEP